jgi:hypothetical protein
MRKRTLLERSLAALVGGMLGGLMTLWLFGFPITMHWVIWTPIPIGVLAGYWRGDRGIRGLIKVVRFMR